MVKIEAGIHYGSEVKDEIISTDEVTTGNQWKYEKICGIKVEDSYDCEQCKSVFKTSLGLRKHNRSNHQGLQHFCNQCDFQTTLKASLYGHRNKKHGAQYSCPNCDFQSTRKDHLKKHQESVHEEAKYFCDQCNYQAAQKYSLKIHKEAKHEGINYSCNMCD